MRTRRTTCRDCGAGWSAVARWCGHCGILLAAPETHRRRRRVPGWIAPGVGVLLLVAAIATLAVDRTPIPEAASDVELPRRAAPPSPGPSGAATGEPADQRCRVDSRAVSCLLWSSDANTRDVTPVSASGVMVGADDDGAVGTDADTGRLRWRTSGLGELIWFHAADEDAEVVLAVDDQRRVLTIRVSDGEAVLTLPFVRPVFPGIVGDHVAVLREATVDVLDVVTGTVVASARRTGPLPSGRLTGPDRFASWKGATVTVHELGDASSWEVDLPLDVIEIGGDAATVVAVLSDGSLAAIDVADRQLRWVSPSAIADGDTLLVTDRVVAATVRLGGQDTIRLLDVVTGTVKRQLGATDVRELRAITDDRILVIDDQDSALGLVVLAPRGAIGDRALEPIRGGGLPVVVGDGQAMISGADGATLVDLHTGGVRWMLGLGTADAVSARTPTVWDDGRLLRAELPSLP